ncbi:hypothetical protein NEDG_01990 [Nematocida displodere]|uniref:GATA-type domain-containing protein n=1 Tax=Nematocida displodere TaxID=1805483 RepID=A0A177EF21_9MICR|nr:hypothetical protein NEDG_01990 [Nematocida displodere]
MAEKRRREIDNHLGNITQFSDDLSVNEERPEYPLERFAPAPFYKKSIHPDYTLHTKDEDTHREWSSTSQWTWNEAPKEEYPWEKEKTHKHPEEITRKKARFRVCTNCGTTTTPSWRRSTNNKMLLCNACGLYQKLHGSDRPFSVTPDGKTKAIKTNIERGICRGCGATQTSLWRKGYNNEWLCSSCGLMYNKRRRTEETYPAQEPWKEYPQETEYPEEYPRTRGQYAPYDYEEAKDDEYFADERFRDYKGGYYDDKRH